MIAIVDSGGANIASVVHAFSRLGVAAQLTADPSTIAAASHVVLPGVGAARHAMAELSRKELLAVIRELRVPLLGICLGMQLLFERSEEGDTSCLGIFPGAVSRLRAVPGAAVPHMGWNRVEQCAGRASPLFAGIDDRAYFYFVHSFAAASELPTITARTLHGDWFAAAASLGRVHGVQFHPERSGEAGARLLRNFVEMT